MNHLLSNIINTRRSRSVENNNSRYNATRGRNLFANAMSLNNRLRRQSSSTINNENTVIENELQDISNNVIQPYNNFNRNSNSSVHVCYEFNLVYKLILDFYFCIKLRSAPHTILYLNLMLILDSINNNSRR